MWVSRKEFDGLKAGFGEVWDSLEKKRLAIEQLYENMATLTKQMKCSCENYEVESRPLYTTHSELVGGFPFTSDRTVEDRYFKICKDCGFVTQYDTGEEALADKQALLDKQIDALKEQKKSLKKK